MSVIIGREIKNYLKNPIYWIGMLVIIVTVFICLSDYLNIHRYSEGEILDKPEDVTTEDADVYYGYISVKKEDIYENGLEIIRNNLTEHMGMRSKEAEDVISDIRSRNMTISETRDYLSEKYGYRDGSAFREASNKKASADEVNEYIESRLKEHSYAYYFANKFADFTGVMISFFAAVILAFLLTADTKKETFELLHTKPVSAGRYILGKFLGGVIVLSSAVLIMMVIFSILCIRNELSSGAMDVLGHMIRSTILYVIPTVIISTAVCVFVSVLFKNPLPTIPVMLLYIIYSNLGSYDQDGYYGFNGRVLGLLFRFPENFFETAPIPMYPTNQLLLLILSGILILLAAVKWKKVRS